MKFLIIGDLHYGKEFSTYQRNKYTDPKIYQQKQWFLRTDEYLRENIDRVSEYVKTSEDIIRVVFVGDEIDAPLLEPEILNYFKSIIQYCIDKFDNNLNGIDVVVGTHDCLSYGESGTFLTLLDGYSNIVHVYSKPTVVNLTDTSAILYLPYRDTKNFVDLINDDDLKVLRGAKNVMIFSHNNFCYEYTGNIPLFSIRDFNTNLGINPEFEVVFNGHIHLPYIKKKDNIEFIQVGSISPLAFDGNVFREGGICLYELDDTLDLCEYVEPSNILIRNDNIAFYKIDNDNSIEVLKSLLINKQNSIFFVKYEASIKDVIEELCKEFTNILYICKYVNTVEILPETEKLVSVKDDISTQISVGDDRNVNITDLFDKYLFEKYGFNTTNV